MFSAVPLQYAFRETCNSNTFLCVDRFDVFSFTCCGVGLHISFCTQRFEAVERLTVSV